MIIIFLVYDNIYATLKISRTTYKELAHAWPLKKA